MASKPTKQTNSATLGVCGDCKHSYDYHEMTNYEPKHPFMCRCPFERWSQFLDKLCVNGKFEHK